ncbi:MAG: ABC transporter substrate-binding protein [Leptothrix sp. (in: Bacteria)]|nr:ABC transporter substrate-binding protein [Leptothrix sp. (in: b-proteobacteria)]
MLWCTLAASLPAAAQTLRWASQGDALTMDPHAQNEGLTNTMNGQVYETLVRRDRELNLVPGLATAWEQAGPQRWRFRLRPGVKFHDGAPLSADDVVFSIQRAQQPTSNVAVYANALGTPVALDATTVEFRLPRVNPVFLQQLATVFIMNKAWCEKHGVTRPLDFKNKEESYAGFHANGTGAFTLQSRQPGTRTTYQRHPGWWGEAAGRRTGNVQAIVFNSIANDATRLAALVSGEIDFVIDPAPRDVPRLRRTAGVKVIEGPENRAVFIGMDQSRSELLYGSVKGRNPFKDLRVRQAMYHAVDIETMRSKLMNGLSLPTGSVLPSPLAHYSDAGFEARLPFDLAKARALMAAAGYADGFEVTLDCPNNRYVNDEEICIALAAMWSQIKLRIKVNAQPRALWFPKMERGDTSLYLLGWGGAVTDAETTLTPVMRAPGPQGVGFYNWGRVKNDKFEALAAASSTEPDAKKREALVKAALREYSDQVHLIPLHRQVIPWAARSNVEVVHRADNWLEVPWVTLK